MHYLIILCLALIGCGCQKDSDDKSTAFVKEESLPLVAVVPIFDRAEHADLQWNLSDELTTMLRKKLAHNGYFSLVKHQEMRSVYKKMEGKHNPFAPDISWMRTYFDKNGFLVFVELLEHQEEHEKLHMRAKLRVVEMRQGNPRIVLQEIVQESAHIPRQFAQAHFDPLAWGEENFHASPLGQAHIQLIKGLAARVEDYIQFAQQK